VILAGEPARAAAPQATLPLDDAEITVLDSRPDRATIRVRTEAPAYLVVATTWYPGWEARLNGESVPLYRANLAFQAVAVPAGGGDVTLRYTLSRWPLAVGLTASGVLAALVLIGAGSLGSARRTPHPLVPGWGRRGQKPPL